MAKKLIKTPENELKNVFVMKLNELSLNTYKVTLNPAKPTSSGTL